MPSGAKKRRAAKRKKQEEALAKQPDEFTSVSIVKFSIPIEKLAKGADLHEAKNTTGEVPDNYKAASVNENAIHQNNEFPLLEVTSNEDNAVSKDVPLVESSENLKGNDTCGMVCEDTTKETEVLTVALEPNFDQVRYLLFDAPKREEILEKFHDLSVNDTTTLDYDKSTGFFLREVPVGSRGEANEVEVLPSNEAASVGKELEEAKRLIGENEEYESVVPLNAGCIIESTSKYLELLSVCASEEKIDTAPLVSVTVTSNENIKEAENTSKFNELLSVVLPEEMKDSTLISSCVSSVSTDRENTFMFHDQFIEAAEGTKDTAQLVSDKDTGFFIPMVGLPAVLSHSSSNEHEVQAVPIRTVSSATVNQVYFACPVHCNSECSFPKWLRDQSVVEITARKESLENFKTSVVELKGAVCSLKEDLQEALEKLDAISY